MKKVLFLSYFFPPAGGGGVQRSSKFVKYLPLFGWESIVVTASENQTDLSDRSLLNDVPQGTEIYRVKSFDPRKFFRQGPSVSITKSQTSMKTWIRKVGKWGISLIFIPDDFIFWSIKAYFTTGDIIRSKSPNLIFSTSAPVSSHVTAFFLKRKFGLPWVADLRDEWSDNPWKIHPTPLHKWIDQQIEKSVLKEADAVISVTQGIADSLERRLNRQVELITNGFDPDDVKLTVRPSKKFTIVNTGSLYEDISPKDILEVLSGLVKSERISKADLEVVLVGKVSAEVAKDLLGFKDVAIKLLGYLDHTKSLKWQEKATILTLIISQSRGEATLTGKIFEYMASKKPILAYVPAQGEAAKLLEKSGAKWVTNFGDKKKLQDDIIEMYELWKKGKLNVGYTGLDQFNRRVLTKKLARLINEVIK